MVDPLSSIVRTDELDGLLASRGRPRTERVVAEGAELSAYGLHAPAVTVALRSDGVPICGEKKPGPQEPHGEKMNGLEISTAEHDGKHYAMRKGASHDL